MATKRENEILAEAKAAVIKQELGDFKEEVVNRLQRIEDKITYTNGKIAKAITDIELNKHSVNNIITNCDKNHTPAKDWKVMVVTAIIGIISVVITNKIIN